jgi:hypothetical protein
MQRSPRDKRRIKTFLFSVLVLYVAVRIVPVNIAAQEGERRPHPAAQPPVFPEIMGGKGVTLDIVARVMEENGVEVWNQHNSKVTISGRPVGIRLVGDNVIVQVQFTPYFQSDGSGFLVVQGQIWTELPSGGGMHYRTTMKTTPLRFGEEVYFFPLGDVSSDKGRIEILVAANPYTETETEADETPAAPQAAVAPPTPATVLPPE